MTSHRGTSVETSFAKLIKEEDDFAHWHDHGEEKGKKARGTGTLPFMAIDVLRSDEDHRYVHDLESFFWVLVWTCLNYQGPKQGPHHTLKPLIESRAYSANKRRYKTLKHLLNCEDLDEGGMQKEVVLADCRKAGRLAEAFNPHWHKLIPTVIKLAQIIDNGRRLDEYKRSPMEDDECMHRDERSYDKFLEILHSPLAELV
ncbi:hypothetical protein SISSUDRAFT_1054208 [Sistotremastrum suecicum HHB10207 ss-3]|uniref:Fungal-type protein kinase domain-containing protein n=1 Tax=Sistotremastrum suecicum HHB10207 ss-3 TaxID=1314776 RepID=A0A165YP58_9AGAM|nr:hypothetical protein SISSUDRAFT_1054208 [Sistotremastrum suecicum HHB10207 ss-3]